MNSTPKKVSIEHMDEIAAPKEEKRSNSPIFLLRALVEKSKEESETRPVSPVSLYVPDVVPTPLPLFRANGIHHPKNKVSEVFHKNTTFLQKAMLENNKSTKQEESKSTSFTEKRTRPQGESWESPPLAKHRHSFVFTSTYRHPLHIAIAQGASSAVLERMIQQDPSALLQPDGDSCCALQTLLHHQPHNVAVVDIMLLCRPELTNLVDRGGNTALHWAVRKGASLRILRHLMAIGRDGWMHQGNRQGISSLRMAQSMTHLCAPEVVDWMQEQSGRHNDDECLALLDYNDDNDDKKVVAVHNSSHCGLAASTC